MHDSDKIILSVAPPHIERMGVGSESRLRRLCWYILSIRASTLAGGNVWGVDKVMIAEISGHGRRAVATTPPIE